MAKRRHRKSDIPFGGQFSLEQTPLPELLRMLQCRKDRSENKAILEALIVHISRLLDLDLTRQPHRCSSSGNDDLYAIAESARLLFTRWAIYCTHVKLVDDDAIAKAIGLSLQTRCNVILCITTGEFSPEAEDYAADVARCSNLQVVFLDGSNLARIAQQPLAIREALRACTHRTAALKCLG